LQNEYGWITGQEISPSTWNNWVEDQPGDQDDSTGADRCVATTETDEVHPYYPGWQATDCTSKFKSLCAGEDRSNWLSMLSIDRV